MDYLIQYIYSHDLETFISEWSILKDSFTESEKQDFLFEVIECYDSDKDFPFFKKIFDEIIDGNIPLDFNIDHWAPTFLSMAVYLNSQLLFDYLLSKGASINFIGNNYLFETNESEKQNVSFESNLRYLTCLDFAEIYLADTLTVDYNYYVPESPENLSWHKIEKHEEIIVNKQEYYYLLEQSRYLRDLIKLDKLVDHIRSLGGKTYQQLKES